MAQKRNRVRKTGIVPVPIPKKDLERRLELSPRLKEKLKPYRPKPKKFEGKEKELLDEMFKKSEDRMGKPVKPKPKVKPKPPKRGDKKFKVEKPIYRGESLGKGKSSQEI